MIVANESSGSVDVNKLKSALTHAQFRDECRRAFAYLKTDYGFEEQPEDQDPERYMISFANSTTRITIRGGSFGHWTDVFFDRANAVHNGHDLDYGHNILNLFAVRGYAFPLRDYAFDKLGCWSLLLEVLRLKRVDPLQAHQQLQIPVYADAVRHAAADILAGDFSVLPDVLVQAEKRRRSLQGLTESRAERRIRGLAQLSMVIGAPISVLSFAMCIAAGSSGGNSGLETVRLFFALVAIISFSTLVGGVGLLKYRNWARMVIITAGVLLLLVFPFGTAYGVYAIYTLFHREARPLFGTDRAHR